MNLRDKLNVILALVVGLLSPNGDSHSKIGSDIKGKKNASDGSSIIFKLIEKNLVEHSDAKRPDLSEGGGGGIVP